MKFIGNFYSSSAKEKFQLEVNITGIDYLNKDECSCLERGLDNYISNMFFSDLTDVAKQIYEYLNNCEISKTEFDLTISLIELKTAISNVNKNGDVSLKISLDEANSLYKKETVNYKNGEFQSYMFDDNTEGIKKFEYSKDKKSVILENNNFDIQTFTNTILGKIEKLKRIIPVKLDTEIMNVLKSYSLFYSKILDPNDKLVVSKLRYMSYILQSFNVKVLPPIWSYVSSFGTDDYLINIVNQLKNVEIISTESTFDIDEKTCKKILQIGDIIENYIWFSDDDLSNVYDFCEAIEKVRLDKVRPPVNLEKPFELIRQITNNYPKN